MKYKFNRKTHLTGMKYKFNRKTHLTGMKYKSNRNEIQIFPEKLIRS
jgi:hypothetical protein